MERQKMAETQLRFSCGNCGVTLSVPTALAGVRGPCPHCQNVIEAPVPSVRLAPRPVRPNPVSLPARPPVAAETLPKRKEFVSAEAEAAPKPLRLISPTLERERSVPSPSTPRRGESRRKTRKGESNEDQVSGESPLRWWGLIALGMIIGVLGSFAAVSIWDLKRDLSPSAPSGFAEVLEPSENSEDAIAALDELKRESARESRALLAAQGVVWRFFSAESTAEAMTLLDQPPSEPLATTQRRASVEKVMLRAKRRLADEAGYTTQWTVVTAQFGELSVETTDVSGEARLRWSALAPQLLSGQPTPTAMTAFHPMN